MAVIEEGNAGGVVGAFACFLPHSVQFAFLSHSTPSPPPLKTHTHQKGPRRGAELLGQGPAGARGGRGDRLGLGRRGGLQGPSVGTDPSSV